MGLFNTLRSYFQTSRQVLFTNKSQPQFSISYSIPADVGESRFFAKSLFQSVTFSDLRLQKRAISIMSSLFYYPGRSFCQAFGAWGQSKAFYRFIDNPRVSSIFLEEATSRRGSQWCNHMEKVYIVSDTTTLSLTNLKKNKDLGPVNHDLRAKGIHVHSSMALTPKGIPIGIVDQQVWTRDPQEAGKSAQRHQRPIEEKESYKWIEVWTRA